MFYPLELLADFLVYQILTLEADTLLAKTLTFFISDVLKIFILLLVIIFIVSFIRTYLPQDKVRSFLAKQNKYVAHLLASLFGLITPFCSCSAVPLFLGFVESGIPLGVTFSFLVASPMINEVALALLFGLFGWQIALIYVFSGLVIAIISGLIIGRLKPETLLLDLATKNSNQLKNAGQTMLFSARLSYSLRYSLQIIRKVWPYVIIGVALGAWIHGYVPADFLAQYADASKWYAVPLAVIIGIPLYSNAAGVIPLVYALTEKGVALGTVLAFMMAITALSLPEFMILKRIMKVKLIAIFAAVVGLGIILTGYLFNFIL